jgi:hypothetical protein
MEGCTDELMAGGNGVLLKVPCSLTSFTLYNNNLNVRFGVY